MMGFLNPNLSSEFVKEQVSRFDAIAPKLEDFFPSASEEVVDEQA